MKTTRSPRLELTIDEDLIKHSMERDSSHCMIAEAVKAAYPDAQRVSVDIQTIRFSDPRKGLRYTYLTPRIGQIALVKFDQGIKPEPFTVQLRNGQVTAATNLRTREQSSLSPAQKAQRIAASKQWQEKNREMKRARLAAPEAEGSVPDKIGGRTPPLAPLARRRAFGLRALEH